MSDESSDNDPIWWMPADQPDAADQEDPPGRPGWMLPTGPIGPTGLRPRSRRPYIVAGVAVAALLGGAGAALAASRSSAPAAPASAVITNPSPSPGQSAGPVPAVPGFHRFGPGPRFGGGPFGVVHGQFVMGKPGGGYQTVDVQNGRVTAVSSTSITLKSADGFTKSYAVTGSTLVDAQRDGIGSVKVGNQASVQATVSGSTATALSIEDLTLLQRDRPPYAPGWQRGVQVG
jgi:hypothetical protein